ncbi:hypothetical protein VP395_13250 [Mariniflexile soesokkakense]|uniref:Uncharacterized protein n=1 Tax=Mariniflexile soesokkakense TaxID=1343160 RepID=A0ABV0AC74_9FLAO
MMLLQHNIKTLKEAYTIVIEDSKDELNSLGMIFVNPKEFLENFTNDYLIDSKNRIISKIIEFKSNENDHAQAEITWTEEDGDFYMLVTTVETKKYFYKILCWTLLENKADLKSDFLTISKSIQD